jgi:hypothetical protein
MSKRAHDYRGLVIIVPTRNRSSLAITAVRSALNDRGDIHILVSDNSTDPEHAAKLRRACESLPVRYIRPDQPLGMAPHWDWAIQQALDIHDASHLTVLTDRFVFRPGAVADLTRAASEFPDDAIMFRFDNVYDQVTPCYLSLSPWAGGAYRCRSDDLLRMHAAAHNFHMVPTLLNAVVTRSVLRSVRERFGNYCLSISPDFALGFRALALTETVILLDRVLSINWGRSVSNGMNLSRQGRMGTDYAGESSELAFSATPLPELTITSNAVMHEYMSVRNAVGGDKFPMIDMPSYIKVMRAEIGWLENDAARRRFVELLDQYAPGPNGAELVPPPWRPNPYAPHPKTVKQRIKDVLVNDVTQSIWWWLYRYFGIKLPRRYRDRFLSGEQALYYALRTRSPRAVGLDHVPKCYIEVGGA